MNRNMEYFTKDVNDMAIAVLKYYLYVKCGLPSVITGKQLSSINIKNCLSATKVTN